MTRPILRAGGLLVLAAAVGNAQGIITTAAGASKCCASVDGAPAVNAWLASASGITVDKQGNLYIWQGGGSKVRKVDTAGTITTVAGNGTFGYSGDGGPALSAGFQASGSVTGLAVDGVGNLYISDGGNHVIRKVNPAGIITTVAGNGISGFSGDGGPATSAQLFYPAGIALDTAGNLYIADSSNSRVRKVSTAGIITTVAGNGNVKYSGDGVAATTVAVDRPEGVTVDLAGNLYIAETSSSRVRKVDTSGIITTYAGQTTETNGFSGDGGLATAAKLYGPIGLATDPAGNLYIADNINNRVRKVDAAGIITTYAGIGGGNAATPIGDGGPATSAYIGVAKDVALDSAGNLYIAGSGGGVVRVRKVAPATGLATQPSSLSFSYAIGGANPSNQTVSVTSSGAASTFTATATTTSGGNWLTVNPTSGTTPATLTVSVNAAGVPGGVYQGAVTLNGGGSSLTFGVTLTVTGAGAPVFSASTVQNALGYQAKLAPDTFFVIFGSGMGPANIEVASPPYPASLAGTSVTFTPVGGGTAINAKMYYTVAGQIAGLLPSSITPGTYAVRVTYNTLTSAPQNVTVVARSFGIATANSSGTGTAQATIGNVNGGVSLTRFTKGSTAFNGLNWTLSPAHPGDTLVLWGTGGGADAANDGGGTSGDQTQAGGFSVIVSGHAITPLYAGASSGYPGLWQINFTLPADIAPDCFASVLVSAGGELSNAVSIPIAGGGQDTCSDPLLSKDALTALDGGGTIALGGFGIAKTTLTTTQILTPGAPSSTITANQEIISGGIALYTAAEYAAIYAGIKIDACAIQDRTGAATVKNPASPEGYLNLGSPKAGGPGFGAGVALPVMSPNPGPVYGYVAPSGTIVAGGRYTVSSTGGTGVGPFNGAVTFPSSFAITGWDSLNTIDRSKPLTLSWTGGTGQVYIIGNSTAVLGKDATNTNILHTVSFTCQVPASQGSYTIPAAVLSYLPPASIEAYLNIGSAILAVETVNWEPFTAPLVSGGQAASAGFSGTLSYARNLTVQ